MRRTTFLPLGLVVAVVATSSAACLYLFFSYSDECGDRSHYVIESEKLTAAPSKYVQLNESDLATYPLLKEVIDAFEASGPQPGVTFVDGVLNYEIFENRNETRVTETNDYLMDRLLSEYGPPLDLPVHFSVAGKNSEVYYYSWSVVVIDDIC